MKQKFINNKRDYLILIMVLLPLFCGGVINILISYNQDALGSWLWLAIRSQQLIKNLSVFAFGVILVINPEFFTRIVKKQLSAKEMNPTAFKILLRVVGLALLIIVFVSSRYLLQELFNSI